MRLTSAFAVLFAGLPSAFAATRTFDFNVVNGVVAPDGLEREWEITGFSRITCQIVIYTAVLINDQYPAPLITANKGDRLVTNTHNKLSDPRMRRSVSIVRKKLPFIIFFLYNILPALARVLPSKDIWYGWSCFREPMSHSAKHHLRLWFQHRCTKWKVSINLLWIYISRSWPFLVSGTTLISRPSTVMACGAQSWFMVHHR